MGFILVKEVKKRKEEEESLWKRMDSDIFRTRETYKV